jgi:hypothetical protein
LQRHFVVFCTQWEINPANAPLPANRNHCTRNALDHHSTFPPLRIISHKIESFLAQTTYDKMPQNRRRRIRLAEPDLSSAPTTPPAPSQKLDGHSVQTATAFHPNPNAGPAAFTPLADAQSLQRLSQQHHKCHDSFLPLH